MIKNILRYDRDMDFLFMFINFIPLGAYLSQDSQDRGGFLDIIMNLNKWS